MYPDPQTTDKVIEQAAKEDFDTALRKGFWRSVATWFTKSKNELMPYDEIRRRLPFRGQHDIGIQQIPLEQVVGSVGRYNDFDRAFLPRHTHTRGRWISIDMAQMQDVILPPIEVYKIGSVYFVKDGNHRVSVARQRGQAFIDAQVTEIDANVDVTPNTDVDDLIRQVEQATFYETTQLKALRPDAVVTLTLPGGYDRLLEHISVHRWFMGENRGGPVSYEEAVTSWYDELYMPLVNLVREKEFLKDFPGRSEADLYVYITEHLWYLREENKEEAASLNLAAEHFVDKYSERPFRGLASLVDWLGKLFSGSDDNAGKGDAPHPGEAGE